jgi:hypothetical protein
MNTSASLESHRSSKAVARRVLVGVLACVALAGVFSLYLQPSWVMQLSQLLWTCL